MLGIAREGGTNDCGVPGVADLQSHFCSKGTAVEKQEVLSLFDSGSW